MNRCKIVMALVSLMCLSSVTYADPQDPVRTAEELKALEGKITIDDVSKVIGPGVAIRHVDLEKEHPFVYNKDVTINLTGTDVEGYTTLTTGSLTGTGGHFNMRTDIAGGQGDKLRVGSGELNGNHLVTVTNDGSANVNGNETPTIIETNEKHKDTALDRFKLTNVVEVGGYEYDLRAVENKTNNLELAATGKATNPGGGGVNLFGSKYALAYVETQTLMKRLGDLRETGEASNGDIWARWLVGKMSSGGDKMLRGFDMTYSGIQIGSDKRFDRKDGKGTSYVGGFLGYNNGSPDFSGGDGNLYSYSLGAYWSHVHNSGLYTDLVLKYGWMDSKYDIRDSAGRKVKTSADSEVLTLSLEVGKRFHFDKDTKEGYYIEPQAQFTYAHFDGDSFKASNGLRTKVDSFASKLGRFGLHLGYETKNTKNPMNLYIKGYFMKEFDGNIDYRFNGGKKHTSSYEDNWFVYGFGATMQLGNKNNQNLYLDFERSNGGRLDQNWAINLGYRYSF